MSVQMSNFDSIDNGVNESGFTDDGLSPGRYPMAAQHRTSRHQATVVRTRRKWSHEENRIVMECFYKSDPGIIGYRKRMYKLWCDKDMFQVTEQRLLDQKNQILKKGWLTDLGRGRESGGSTRI